MDLAQFWFQAPAGGGYAVGNALRFRGSQYLRRNFPVAGNRKKFTHSVWVKRGKLGPTQSPYPHTHFTTDNDLTVYNQTVLNSSLVRLFRDPSAWYHIVFIWDSTLSTASNIYQIWINGVRETAWHKTYTVPGTNSEGQWNNTGNHDYGQDQGGNYFDGYIAEAHFVDGQALTPTSFGEFNADGVWVPKKVSGVTYGTNGFYLDFSDAADIGADRSGNGNDFTPTGFELTDTTSSNYDSMSDSPTDNFSTLNAVARINGTATYTEANLKGTQSNGPVIDGTIPLGSNTYWEVHVDQTGNTSAGWGVKAVDDYTQSGNNISISPRGIHRDGVWVSGGTDGGGAPAIAAGQTIGFAFTANAKSLAIYVNNVLQDTVTVSDTSRTFAPSSWSGGGVTSIGTWNFGNRPLAYTPPAGFEPLSTAELPDVAIANPSNHVQVIKDTAANILTNCQTTFPNGFYWIMERSGSAKMRIVDSVRGGTKMTWNYNVGGGTTAYQQPASNAWAMCFNTASAPATNNAGTISANVSANPLAGISQIHYTGNGTAGATVGHGLNGVDVFVVVQDTQNEQNVLWASAMSDHYGNNNMQVGFSNKNDPYGANIVNNAKPSSTVITLGNDPRVNQSGQKYIILAFQNVPGFSNFVKYLGSGGTNNTFVYHGFTPLLTLHKATNNTQSWHFMANVNKTGNPVVDDFATGNNEYFNGNVGVQDFVSNGSKLREQNQIGDSGVTYFQWAFAEHPFGGSNISPAPAR